MASEWIGAAVTASLVSGLVTAAGWWATHRNSLRLDELRRVEKIRDYKSALAAEIVSNLDRFSNVDLAAHRDDIAARITAGRPDGGAFSPFVPRYASTFVFDRLLSDIILLPNETIESVVRYYKHEHMLSLFVDDLRSDGWSAREAATRIDMYSDYVRIIQETTDLGATALAALRRSGETA